MKPIIFRENKYSFTEITKLKKSTKVREVIDLYKEQLEELYEIEHPSEKFDPDFAKKSREFINSTSSKDRSNLGDWIFYPWNGQLIHMVNKNQYEIIHTNRNQNIITSEEQKKLSQSVVGVVGLSIGNAMAVSMAYTGVGGVIKMSDFDVLSTSNLNRIRAGIGYVGKPKIEITSQQIYEINPYIKLDLYQNGLKAKELDKFLNGKHKPQVIFEAIDDFEMKIRIRLEAKKSKVPVVMLTNLGDSLLIDIERYDTEKNVQVFNGLIGNAAKDILSKPITEADKQKYAVQIVGIQNVPKRVLDSVMQVNKTLVGRPQLMSTVTIGGGIAAMIARKIILGEKIKSGRTRIVFDDYLLK